MGKQDKDPIEVQIGSFSRVISSLFAWYALHKKVFNKSMEDGADRNIYILCVNDEDGVAAPIKSRCMELRFDVAVLPKNTMKLAMMPYVDFGVDEWKVELKRIGRIVAKKRDMKLARSNLIRLLPEMLVYWMPASLFVI